MAFGPTADSFCLPDGVSGSEVFDAPRSVFLANRIASRWPHSKLVSLCGDSAAPEFRVEMWETAAAELRAEPVIEEVAAAAAELEIPVVFFKGAALLLRDDLSPKTGPGTM